MSARALPAPLPDERPSPAVHLDDWVAPEIADEHGYIRGGKILDWMALDCPTAEERAIFEEFAHRLALQRTLQA